MYDALTKYAYLILKAYKLLILPTRQFIKIDLLINILCLTQNE